MYNFYTAVVIATLYCLQYNYLVYLSTEIDREYIDIMIVTNFI